MAKLIKKLEDLKYPDDMEKAILSCEIKKTGDNEYAFTMSDEVIDRDREVIKADGWELKNFKKNSILMWGHRHDVPGIGEVARVVKENKELKAKKVRFASPGIYELADVVHGLVDDGILKAVSVGYIPIEREWIEDDGKEGKKKPRVITTKAELYELSIVNVGSNPNALRTVKSAEKKAASEFKGDVKQFFPEGPEERDEANVGNDEEPTLDDMLGAIEILYDRIEDLEKRIPEIVEKAIRNKSIYTGLLVGGNDAEKPAEKKHNPFHPTKKGNTIFRG